MPAAAFQIRNYRKLKKISLRDLAAQAGTSASQLSKIESGKARLTVDTALKLAGILQVPASIFLTESAPQAMARRSITRAGSGVRHSFPGLDQEVLCSEFREKANLFWRVRITSRSFEEAGGWRQHPGQEFIFVLKGKMELHSMYYETTFLEEGDSILFDSDQPHSYVSIEDDAEIIMMNTLPRNDQQ